MARDRTEYIWDRWGWKKWDFKNKDRAIASQVKYMLARTQQMFTYDRLPETIPQRMLELYLQNDGFTGIKEYKGKLYAVFGGLGGEPDEYYQPTILTIANPALGVYVNAKIGEDVVIIKNDSLYQGLIPMFTRYATALVENELSMNIASINSRLENLLTAPDDRTMLSAKKLLKDIEDGELGAMTESQILDGLRSLPYSSAQGTQVLKNLIEHEQYIKASWYNELGLNANYNMKRETLTDSENAMNSDALLPLVDDMLRCRQEGLRAVNEKWGLDIQVRLASSWEDNRIELELEHEQAEEAVDNTVENVDNSGEEVPDGETETE